MKLRESNVKSQQKGQTEIDVFEYVRIYSHISRQGGQVANVTDSHVSEYFRSPVAAGLAVGASG